MSNSYTTHHDCTNCGCRKYCATNICIWWFTLAFICELWFVNYCHLLLTSQVCSFMDPKLRHIHNIRCEDFRQQADHKIQRRKSVINYRQLKDISKQFHAKFPFKTSRQNSHNSFWFLMNEHETRSIITPLIFLKLT